MSMGNVNKVTRVKIGGGPVLTKQAFKDQCDINKIIARYEKTGMVEALNKKQPFYGDVSKLKSYQDSLNIINEANELFMALTPQIRDRFHHNPQEMVDFLDDKNNLEEAVKLGMAIKRPTKPAEASKASAEGQRVADVAK